MVKLKYSFSKIMKDSKHVQNDGWLGHNHFLIKKSILNKTELKQIKKDVGEGFIDQLIKTAKGFNEILQNTESKAIFQPDLLIKSEGCNILYDSINDLAINEDYYNMFTTKKCIIYKGSTKLNPTLIYKNDEFIGILLPINTKGNLNGAISYKEYITELEKEQQEQKRIKAERKKLSKETLYIKNNKAIIRKQPLKSLSDVTGIDKYNNIYIEAEPKDKYVELYLDLDIIHMNIGNTIRLDCLDDTNTKNLLDFLSTFTLEKYKEMIEGNLKENKWINTAEIKLMELAGKSEEYIQKLWKHKDYVKELTDKERQEKEEQRRKEEQEYVESQNKIVDDLITQAEQSILNKETVFNEEITIYNDITNRYDSNTTFIQVI